MGVSRAMSSPVEVPRPRPQPLPRVAALRDNRSTTEQAARRLEPLPKTDTARDAQIEAGRKRGVELDDFARSQEDQRGTFRENTRVKPLSDTEIGLLDRIDPGLAAEARQFDTYSSVVNEERLTGKSRTDICRDRKITDFDKTESAVLDRMAGMSIVKDAIPGFEQMTAEQKRTAVDAYVASNPSVRRAYVERMQNLASRALAVPENPTEVADQAAQGKKTELNAERQITVDRMRARLGEKGKDLTDDEIKQMFEYGRSVDEVEMSMVDTLLAKNGIKPAEYHARQEQQANTEQMDVLRQSFQEAHMRGPHASSTFNLEGYLQGNPTNPQVREYQRLQGRNGVIENMKIDITPQQDQTIHDVEEAVYGRINYAKGGVRVGAIREDLQQLHANFAAEKKIDTNSGSLSPEAPKQSAERTLQLENLKAEMADAMEDSIKEGLDQDYARMREINDRKMQADALDAAEKGDVRKRKAIDAILINQGHHGVETDPVTGRKIVHCADIGADTKRIAQDGDMGVRRLELRSLTEGDPPVIALHETDTRGVVVKGSDNKPIPKYFIDEKGLPYQDGVSKSKIPATWETVNMEQLSPGDRQLLEEIHASQGDLLAQRVVVDYFTGIKPPIRGMDLHGTKADLKLTNVQQADLAKYLGRDGIKEAYQESRDLATFKKILHERGLNPNKGGPGWLVMLFLALGAGVVRKKDET